MPSFTTIPNASLLVDKPWTSALALAVRDNTIAIAEADPTVPLALLPTVYLGAINTASGTSATLAGLDLTPFKALRLVWNNVVVATTTTPGGISCAGYVDSFGTFSSNQITGIATYDLATGVFHGGLTTEGVLVGQFAISTATTSINAATTGGGLFAGGDIRVYGLK
jgi:hypothetical protein